MRKKVERLERRNQENHKEVEKSNMIDKVYSKEFLSNIHKLNEMDKQADDWKAVRKHPVTKVVMIVGITIGLVYVSSYIFNAATKATISFKNFKKALES